MVNPERFLGAIDAHGAVLIDAVSSVPLETPVPSCPGWSVANLAAHTAAVYLHKTAIVRDGWVDGPAPYPTDIAARTDEGVVNLLVESLNEMLSVLGNANPEAPAYTWSVHDGTNHVAWWIRRMAHETLIHAADGILATGGTPTAEEWLGIDGVDEILNEMMVGVPPWATAEPEGGRIDLAASDRTWSLRFGTWSGTSPRTEETYVGEDMVLFDAEGVASTRIATNGANLDLWLWGRQGLEPGAVAGAAGPAERLRALAATATG